MHTCVRVHWNVILVTAIAALLMAALPQAAEAAPTKRQRCITAAEKALGHDIRASDYRIVLGSRAYSETLWTSPRKDLICGFGGREIVKGIIGSGDIFISGAGSSRVQRQQRGLVIGSDGDNAVTYMSGGRFYGHVGFDSVDDMQGGVFRGGPGLDLVVRMHDGRLAGGLASTASRSSTAVSSWGSVAKTWSSTSTAVGSRVAHKLTPSSAR